MRDGPHAMTSATDVLEAVAAAMYVADQKPNVKFLRQPFTDLHFTTQDMWRNLARAAITALAANVSPEMVTAAANALGKRDPVSGDDWKITIAAAIRAGGEP